MAWISKTRKFLRRGKPEEESPLLSAAEEGSSDDETADESPTVVPKSYGAIGTDPHTRPQHQGYFSNVFRSLRDPHRDAQSLDTMRRHSQRERRSLLTEINLRQHERDVAKFQLYSSCLAAGAVLDVILTILTATSKRKLRGEVDSAIVLGVICNLLLLLVAVTSMKSRRERLGWFHQGIVFVLVIAMVVVDALLFRWALGL
jgi:heme/copper-type cytochrome/quinol oxidase subunit 4